MTTIFICWMMVLAGLQIIHLLSALHEKRFGDMVEPIAIIMFIGVVARTFPT